MPIILPPPQKKTKHLSPTALIAAARAGTKTWDQARAGIIAGGTAPADADTLIATARAPKTVTPKGPSASSTLKALSGGRITKQAAQQQLIAGGYTPLAAQQMIDTQLAPSPQTLTTTQILDGLKAGTVKTDQATDLLRTNGLDDQSISILLRTEATQFDKWAVMGADGKVKFATISDPAKPPTNVLKYGPTPLTETQYTQVWTQNYKDTFVSYTGRQASGKEVAAILKRAPSIFTLQTELAKSPTFVKSSIYKQQAPGIISDAKKMLGQGWKPSPEFVAKAISQNWRQNGSLEPALRALPAYLKGPVFTDGSVKKAAVFSQIYGTPSQTDLHTIGQAQLAGWTDDQFAAYLRAQPNYTKSPEYVSKLLSFGQQLGLITGMQPTLQPGGTTPKNPNQPVAQQVPDSKRLPAPGPVKSPIDYSVTGV